MTNAIFCGSLRLSFLLYRGHLSQRLFDVCHALEHGSWPVPTSPTTIWAAMPTTSPTTTFASTGSSARS